MQGDFAECLLQLACYEPGAATLRAEPSVQKALETLEAHALTQQAAERAHNTIRILWPPETEPEPHNEEDALLEPEHVMVSYQVNISPACFPQISLKLHDNITCC